MRPPPLCPARDAHSPPAPLVGRRPPFTSPALPCQPPDRTCPACLAPPAAHLRLSRSPPAADCCHSLAYGPRPSHRSLARAARPRPARLYLVAAASGCLHTADDRAYASAARSRLTSLLSPAAQPSCRLTAVAMAGYRRSPRCTPVTPLSCARGRAWLRWRPHRAFPLPPAAGALPRRAQPLSEWHPHHAPGSAPPAPH